MCGRCVGVCMCSAWLGGRLSGAVDADCGQTVDTLVLIKADVTHVDMCEPLRLQLLIITGLFSTSRYHHAAEIGSWLVAVLKISLSS